MKKLALLIGMLVVFATGSSAWAALTDYNSGSMSTFNGAVIPGMAASGDAWAGSKSGKGVRLDWQVLQDNVSGAWQYNYTFTTAISNNKFLESFDLSVGSGFLVNNLTDYSLTAYTTRNATGTGTTVDLLGLGNYTENINSYNNPDYLAIYGLKWDIPVPASGGFYSFKLTMNTDVAPMWGDFIAEGDPATGDVNHDLWKYNAAWNSNFGITQTIATNLQNVGSVLAPGAPVPIPPSVLLFGSGLSGLFFFRRKKIEC